MTEESTQSKSNYRYGPDERPSEAVIETVADMTDQSPLEMEPLVETIDTDALNSLLDTTEERVPFTAVTFKYSGFQITVTSGEVQAESLDK